MEKKPNKSFGIILLVIFIIIFLAMCSGDGMESEYERAGKEFETWTKQDPNTWTDTEKQYMDDFFDYMDKH